MRVFVTGATGVIGRRLLPLLRARGHQITAVVRSLEAGRRLETLGVASVDVDLFDPREVGDAIAGHDAVVNLATHMPKSTARMFLPWAWRENDRLRRDASGILVDACIAAGVPRLVQESFAPVYPDRGDAWIDESVPIAPARYNGTVADAEGSARRFGLCGGHAVVLRYGAFYGRDAMQTADLVRWVERGWAPVPGPAGAYVSSISHADAAAATAAALVLPSGTYNVVDDEPLTHREYVDSLARALHVDPPRLPPTWMTPLFGAVGEMLARSLRISNAKLRGASSWAPEHPSVREAWPQLVRAGATGRAPQHRGPATTSV